MMENITRLNTCRVEIKTVRKVCNSLAFSPITEMKCSFCNTNRFKDFTSEGFYSGSTHLDILKLYDVMIEVFKQWEEMKPAIITCPTCKNQSNLDEYEIEGTIYLTNFEITYCNWPDLKHSFIDDLSDLIQKPLMRINGSI